MENLANFLATTLLNMPGDLDTTTTTLTLNSTASPFPSGFPFRVRIDDEILKVTATPGSNQWTVTRADGGTTAANHLDGSAVTVVLTKEALDALITVQLNGTEVGSRRTLNFTGPAVVPTDDSGSHRVDIQVNAGVPWEDDVTAPTLGTFAWINQISGAAVTTTSKGSIWLISPPSGSGGLVIQKQARPGSSWTIIMRSVMANLNVATHLSGFLIRDSSSGKIQFFFKSSASIGIQNNNDPATFNSSVITLNNSLIDQCHWWKFVYVSGVTSWYISPDGESWLFLTSTTTTSFLTTPDEVGFFTATFNATYGSGILLNSWAPSSP